MPPQPKPRHPEHKRAYALLQESGEKFMLVTDDESGEPVLLSNIPAHRLRLLIGYMALEGEYLEHGYVLNG